MDGKGQWTHGKWWMGKDFGHMVSDEWERTVENSCVGEHEINNCINPTYIQRMLTNIEYY